MKSNKSVVSKLIGLSLINILGLIIIFVFLYISFTNFMNLDDSKHKLIQIKTNMLTLRRNEKDFLARKEIKYRDEFIKHYNHLDNEITNEITNLNNITLIDDAEKLNKIRTIIRKYKDIFLEISDIQNKIGLNHKKGLYGSLRKSVHQVQNSIKELKFAQALAFVYELRKHEKDFMLRFDKKYLYKYESTFSNLVNLIESSDLSDTIKEKNLLNLNTYKKDFLELVKYEEIKGLNSKSGLLGKMRSTIHQSEKNIEILYKDIEEHINKSIEELIIILSVIVLVVIGIILGSSSYMSKKIIQQLKDSISELVNSSKHVEHSSSSLNEGSHNLSNMALEQSASVEEITATVEQILINTIDNFSNMKKLDELGNDMKSNANIGYSHMLELKESMECIATSSTQINTIVNTIDEISFQTNLLALNAAVEAARAGEHGLGFAVVSEEVRSLATRSTNEAKKIHSVIEKAVEESEKGIIVANNTNESFNIIVNKIKTTMELIGLTTISSKEQREAIEQLKTSILEVDKVTQQLSVNSEEISGMAESLNKEAISTNKIIKQIL
jgi:methyl-accepting chemotaxis protein